MLQIRGLTVRFGAVTAVDRVDLDVADGSVTAVMGPSGSGKSTLLRAVAGLEHPDAGDILWDGTSIVHLPPHRRDFGLMFQDYALFPHRSVAGNVAFGLRMKGMPATEVSRRVEAILELVDMAEFGDRSVGSLSGGQQQRVALARTLAPEPRMVLLDEPLGALDRTLRDELVDEMRVIFETLGTTVLYVTHDRTEAFAVGERVAVLDEGELVAQGTAEELWNRPGSPFLARFIGLENVVPSAVLGPWLRSRPDGDDHHAVVPAEALRLAAAGSDRDVTVLRDRFRDGRHLVTVETAAGVELVAASDRRWKPGDRAGLVVDEDRVTYVPSR